MTSRGMNRVGWTLAVISLSLFFITLYFFDNMGVALGFIAGCAWVGFRWIVDESRIRRTEELKREMRNNNPYPF